MIPARPQPAATALATLALALVSLVPATASAQATQPATLGGVAVEPIERQTDAGPIRGYIATIALDDPTLDIVVTDPLDAPPAERVEAILEPTDAWAIRIDAIVAVNANFFAWLDRDKQWSDLIGLAVSDGKIISESRSHNDLPDPALVFDRRGLAAIARPGDQLDHVYDAVSTVGASDSDPDGNALLITDGRNTAEHARVAPNVRHPRTAAGVKDDGRTLVLVVIDGRQPGWSVGVTLPELADLMLEHGVQNAINLDGGGSSAFVFRNPITGKTIATNSPSDGEFRPVANHLGVRYDPDAFPAIANQPPDSTTDSDADAGTDAVDPDAESTGSPIR